MRVRLRWPWEHPPREETRREADEDARAEALSARQRAEIDLARIQERQREVSTAAAKFREIRGANHFAQAILEAYRRTT